MYSNITEPKIGSNALEHIHALDSMPKRYMSEVL